MFKQETPSSGIAEWELDNLIRHRTWQNLHSATTDLHSLSELVTSLTNMVISDNIQTTVLESLDAMEKAQKALLAEDLSVALQQSRIAMKKAHEAFFDPNMLGMLYFPDEHKFAIYTPL